jgi:hypothetical protein
VLEVLQKALSGRLADEILNHSNLRLQPLGKLLVQAAVCSILALSQSKLAT